MYAESSVFFFRAEDGVRHGRVSRVQTCALPIYSAGIYLASIGIGLQNGMASTYSGMVFRTTHVSGMFTDLGIYIGQRMRGLPVDALRVGVCLLVVTCFTLGGTAGALLFRAMGERALLVPAALTGLCGMGYGIYRQYTLSRGTAGAD